MFVAQLSRLEKLHLCGCKCFDIRNWKMNEVIYWIKIPCCRIAFGQLTFWLGVCDSSFLTNDHILTCFVGVRWWSRRFQDQSGGMSFFQMTSISEFRLNTNLSDLILLFSFRKFILAHTRAWLEIILVQV